MADFQRYVLPNLDISFVEVPVEFEEQYAKEIAENWQREIVEKPKLFNGAVLVAVNHRIENNCFYVECARVNYATLLYWRRIGRPADVGLFHIFASGVIVSPENGLLVAQMADHTANAGAVYFPAGSFDDDDISAVKVDVFANMRRELKEETGLTHDGMTMLPNWHVYLHPFSIHIYRLFRASQPEEELLASVEKFIGDEELSELSQASFLHDLSGPFAGKMLNSARDLAQLVFDDVRKV